MGKVLRFNRRRSSLRSPRATFLVAGGIGIGAVVASTISLYPVSAASPPTYPETVTNCRVVDGDTLHCDGGRIRLLGIDAPELPGHCAVGRECAPGDPYASTQSLTEGLGDGSSVKIENVGTDRYGRTLAMVLGQGGDLSCWQLARHQAIYKPRWDNGGRVAKACRF
jgi:endonuclease YncB( thermonuclease family)